MRSSYIFTEENKRSKLLQKAVAKMKWRQRNVWQMAEKCSSDMIFFSLRPGILYPIPSSDNHSQTKNVLQFQILKEKECNYTL